MSKYITGGRLLKLVMMPTRLKNFSLNRASRDEAVWLRDVLTRESGRFGVSAELASDDTLVLRW